MFSLLILLIYFLLLHSIFSVVVSLYRCSVCKACVWRPACFALPALPQPPTPIPPPQPHRPLPRRSRLAAAYGVGWTWRCGSPSPVRKGTFSWRPHRLYCRPVRPWTAARCTRDRPGRRAVRWTCGRRNTRVRGQMRSSLQITKTYLVQSKNAQER